MIEKKKNKTTGGRTKYDYVTLHGKGSATYEISGKEGGKAQNKNASDCKGAPRRNE